MKKDTVELFRNKYVKLERQKPTDNRPFKLFGTIKTVTEDSITFQTKQRLGAIRLCDIVSIEEWDD
jgi:hypothetical protein